MQGKIDLGGLGLDIIYGEPGCVFVFYTFKTVTFSDIQNIIPATPLAKIVEMLSFFILGVLILIIVFSIGFSLRQSKIDEDTRLIKQFCDDKSNLIRSYVKDNYNKDFNQLLKETDSIKNVIKEVRSIYDRVF